MKLGLIGEGACPASFFMANHNHSLITNIYFRHSCAWRHCGAQADAQESLAELYNLLGVLEPFECLFCLDIVERSLHDILAVSHVIHIPHYTPYQARGGEDSALDMDFLEALKGLRSQY